MLLSLRPQFEIKLIMDGEPRTATCEPVWPSGKAGKRRDLGSNPLRLSFRFKSCGLWTLSCDFVPHNYETLKWLIAARLNA